MPIWGHNNTMKIEYGKNESIRMRLGELSLKANVTRSKIYHYLRSGILHPPIKEGPTQSRYDQTHLERLEEIRYLRERKKLSIPEIQAMYHVEGANKADLHNPSSDVKRLIFEKALELFSRNGFSKTKISHITNALNLGKGTFYLYYKSKEELFLECIDRVPEIILPPKAWAEIRKERDYFLRQKRRAHLMLESFPTFMGIISIAKLSLRGDDPIMAKKAKECFQTITRPLVKEMKRAMENGVLPKDLDAQYLAFMTFSAAEAAGYWLIMNPEYSTAECADKLIDFMAHGLGSKQNDIAGRFNSNTVNGTLEDLNANRIMLQGLIFNKETCIEGRIGGGTLRIDTAKIGSIEAKRTEQIQLAHVTMRTGETVTIQIDASVMVSGDSSFGDYTIPISEVNTIVMEP